MSRIDESRRRWREKQAKVAQGLANESQCNLDRGAPEVAQRAQEVALAITGESARKPVKAIVQDTLVTRDGWLTYMDLAEIVYGTTNPTAAQMSALRRAVAVLAANGHAHRTRSRPARIRTTLTDENRAAMQERRRQHIPRPSR